MGNTSLSLCMIVKNEEDCIGRCLHSVKDVVDEIIIVDTGSTDKTIEICQSFHAKIETFMWNDSFADARNYGIEKASGDWILWLDADEVLDETAHQVIRNGKHFEEYDAITLLLINYYGDQKDINQSTDIAHTRLFRNNGIQFISKMHEHLDLKNIPKTRIGHLNVKVHHYGYLKPIVEKKEKTERNLKMLRKQIEEGENVYWAHYFIALEYYHKKSYAKALEEINLSILSFLTNKALPPSMVYKLKYSILIAMGSLETALPGIQKAITLYPDYVDLHFFKGLILYFLKKYEDAIHCFMECLKMGEENRDYLILKGVGSFQAWYYISLCQKELKKNEEAIVSIMQSLLIAPEYKEALRTLSQFMNEDKKSVVDCIHKHFSEENHKTLNKIIQKIGK